MVISAVAVALASCGATSPKSPTTHAATGTLAVKKYLPCPHGTMPVEIRLPGKGYVVTATGICADGRHVTACLERFAGGRYRCYAARHATGLVCFPQKGSDG
jgi:hypothetical protein